MEYATQRVEVSANADDLRREELNGETYLVAPIVAVQEMVLKGEFLPYEEIARSAPAWNAKPATVSHPTDSDGGFLPASAPGQHESHVVGKMFEMGAEDSSRSLAGEVWLRVDRSDTVANSLDRDDPVALLEGGETVEVSTGYWYRRVDESGTHDGDSYEAVQRDVAPDHVAMLPNAQGECSVEDGCGAARDDAPPAAVEGSIHATATGAAGTGHEFIAAEDGDEELVDDALQAVLAGQTAIDEYLFCDCVEGLNAVDAANLLDTARTPSYDATSRGEWSAPNFEDYVEALGYEDVSTVNDLTDEQRSEAASTSLLGDADASTFAELVFFPVVDPAAMTLNERALRAVLSGRGAQADISDEQLASARGVARSLLEEEFDVDFDDQTAASLVERGLEALGLERLLGDDAERGAAASTGDGRPTEPGEQTDDQPTPINMDYDIETLADSSAFSEEQLEDMDENQLDALAESVLDADDAPTGDGGDDPTGNSGSDAGNDAIDDEVAALREEVQSLKEQQEAQKNEKRSELTREVTTHADAIDEEQCEAMDLDALEALADEVVPHRATHVGARGSPATGGDSDVAAAQRVDEAEDLDEVVGQVGGPLMEGS